MFLHPFFIRLKSASSPVCPVPIKRILLSEKSVYLETHNSIAAELTEVGPCFMPVSVRTRLPASKALLNKL